MKLKVLKIDNNLPGENIYICEDEKGGRHRVDLLVSGDIQVEKMEDLIGKEIYAEIFPFIELASYAKIL